MTTIQPLAVTSTTVNSTPSWIAGPEWAPIWVRRRVLTLIAAHQTLTLSSIDRPIGVRPLVFSLTKPGGRCNVELSLRV
jgi:hypothetical protein